MGWGDARAHDVLRVGSPEKLVRERGKQGNQRNRDMGLVEGEGN